MGLEFATTDICDAHESSLADGSLWVLEPGYLSAGKHAKFAGIAFTIRVFEENALVRATLETAGDGRVLVVDAGGSKRCAVLGGNLAMLAQTNGWAGVIVYGCVRDLDEIDACAIGVRALASHPRKSAKRDVGEAGVLLAFSGARVASGHWVYADRDGIVFSATARHLPSRL